MTKRMKTSRGSKPAGTLRYFTTFKAIKEYLAENEIEGIVFWLNGEPVCKIKRTDFGFEWPLKEVD